MKKMKSTEKIESLVDSYRIIKLYRGLRLSNETINNKYRKMADTKEQFQFKSFTSTSIDEGVAKKFAF